MFTLATFGQHKSKNGPEHKLRSFKMTRGILGEGTAGDAPKSGNNHGERL